MLRLDFALHSTTAGCIVNPQSIYCLFWMLLDPARNRYTDRSTGDIIAVLGLSDAVLLLRGTCLPDKITVLNLQQCHQSDRFAHEDECRILQAIAQQAKRTSAPPDIPTEAIRALGRICLHRKKARSAKGKEPEWVSPGKRV